MADATRCPRCASLDVTFKHLVERSYIHPMMGMLLALLTAGFVGVNTGSMLATIVVAVGMVAFALTVPVMKQIIGSRHTCQHCGLSWTATPEVERPRLRIVR